MAFCIECGSKLPDNAKFCLECGQKVVHPNNIEKKTNESGSVKFRFHEQEQSKYKEETASEKTLLESTAAPTIVEIDSSAEEEYFDDEDSIELFDSVENTVKTHKEDVDIEGCIEDEHVNQTSSVKDEEQANELIEESSFAHSPGLSVIQDYEMDSGDDTDNISVTPFKLENPKSDPYWDDIKPEIDNEINKTDKTIVFKVIFAFSLLIIAALWLIYFI